MSHQDLDDDRPINLEDSTIVELKRVIVTDDESPSTRPPVIPRTPHAPTDNREILHQPFGTDKNA